MKVIVDKNGKLVFEERDTPPLKANELRISVKAIGVNHADLLQRNGHYPPPLGASEILGLEVAGEVEELGSNTTRFHKGDRVMCLLSSGGYADSVAAIESHCIPIPHNLSFEEAAAIPEAFLTAYQALYQISELEPNSHVLIHAAASGVGTAAIQLARQFDAQVIATTRSKEKIEACLSLGAHAVINTFDGQFADKVMEATNGHGVDLIVDFIGASYFDENVNSLATGGSIIILSTLGGSIKEHFDFRALMKKWATITGTTLRGRSDTYKTKLIEEFSQFALSRFESGKIKPLIHATVSWENAEKAHEILKSSQAVGKIVLSLTKPWLKLS